MEIQQILEQRIIELEMKVAFQEKMWMISINHWWSNNLLSKKCSCKFVIWQVN